MRFNVDPDVSLITGRNGTFAIPEIEISAYGAMIGCVPKVIIDGIGKRGYEINGGLVVDKPSFMKGIIAFLEEQGYKVIKETVTVTDDPLGAFCASLSKDS